MRQPPRTGPWAMETTPLTCGNALDQPAWPSDLRTHPALIWNATGAVVERRDGRLAEPKLTERPKSGHLSVSRSRCSGVGVLDGLYRHGRCNHHWLRSRRDRVCRRTDPPGRPWAVSTEGPFVGRRADRRHRTTLPHQENLAGRRLDASCRGATCRSPSQHSRHRLSSTNASPTNGPAARPAGGPTRASASAAP